MSLRGRLTLWPAAIAVLVAVLTAGAAYAVVRHELRERVDDRLAADTRAAREGPGGGAAVVVVSPDGVRVPVSARPRRRRASRGEVHDRPDRRRRARADADAHAAG